MFGLLLVLLLPPVTALLVLVIVLATFGKSLGIRELYADMLIRIFEWGSATLDEPSPDEFLADQSANAAPLNKKRHSSGDLSIIKRDKSMTIESKLNSTDSFSNKSTVSVLVDDSLDFITAGIESIIEDQVTSRFKSEQLPSWNLLTRTRFSFHYISWKLTILWIGGYLFRYFVLVPLRVVLFIIGVSFMILTTSAVGYVPYKPLRKWLNRRVMLMSMRIIARSFSSIIRFHNRENRAEHGGICVANHTSPVDVMILSVDNCYAMIGQKQGGFLGFLQMALSRAEHHIWFERSEATDRKKVSEKLREHVNDSSKLPIIIFPEGTCINNTGVMMFKKGSFEISTTIYPIAMKYDSRLGDPFWNSSEQSYVEYLWRMMTSWAIICDVWYLPKMTRQDNEDAIAFARRVKAAIAKKGGLVDLEWDGMLKRERVSSKLIQLNQKLYYERLARTTSINANREKHELLSVMEKLSDEDRSHILQEMDNCVDENAMLEKIYELMPDMNKVSEATEKDGQLQSELKKDL